MPVIKDHIALRARHRTSGPEETARPNDLFCIAIESSGLLPKPYVTADLLRAVSASAAHAVMDDPVVPGPPCRWVFERRSGRLSGGEAGQVRLSPLRTRLSDMKPARSGPPDHPVCAGHRTPPAAIANSVVGAMSIM